MYFKKLARFRRPKAEGILSVWNIGPIQIWAIL
jgi:hypothetical protein